MTFSVLPDALALSDLMAELEAADPYVEPPIVSNTPNCEVSVRLLWPYTPGKDAFIDSIVWQQVWEYRHVMFVRDVLLQNNGYLVLVSDKLSPREVTPKILDHIAPSRIRYGIFDALDYRLAELKDYDGSGIFIQIALAEKIRKQFTKKDTGGRPVHTAKLWYEKRGFQRNGTIKALQREMEVAVGSAPCETTIRAWERER